MKKASTRFSLCILFIFIGIAFLHKPFIQLARLSLHNQLYSYFLGIPLISLYFLVANRKAIFEQISYSRQTGMVMLGAGMLLTDSFLHKSGGFIFYIFALLLMVPILWLLRRNDKVQTAAGQD